MKHFLVLHLLDNLPTVCTTVSKRKLEGGFPQRVTDGTNPQNIRILKDLLLV